jgi:CRISPR/Cas system CMR-associated protein Cmr5 small subunit
VNYFNNDPDGCLVKSLEQGERLPALKLVNQQVVEVNQKVIKEDYKKAFGKEEAVSPEVVSKNIMDTFWQKNINQKLKQEYGSRFNKLETVIKSYALELNRLYQNTKKRTIKTALKPSTIEGTLQNTLKRLDTMNKEILAEYPKLKEFMEEIS